MMKKIGFVGAGMFAGMAMLTGFASAEGLHIGQGPDGETDTEFGLVNLHNVDAAHNVNVNAGVCDNDINVLGVLADVHDVGQGIGVPLLSQGDNVAASAHPDTCAGNSNVDGGTYQDD